MKARSWPSFTVAPASSSHLRAAAAIHAGRASVGAPMHAGWGSVAVSGGLASDGSGREVLPPPDNKYRNQDAREEVAKADEDARDAAVVGVLAAMLRPHLCFALPCFVLGALRARRSTSRPTVWRLFLPWRRRWREV
jgi:hypothetical protein